MMRKLWSSITMKKIDGSHDDTIVPDIAIRMAL